MSMMIEISKGLFNNYVTHKGGWVSAFFMILRDGRQVEWVVPHEKPSCHDKKSHKAFFCTIVKKSRFH